MTRPKTKTKPKPKPKRRRARKTPFQKWYKSLPAKARADFDGAIRRYHEETKAEKAKP